jgi:DNA (cytosine-5)-methyltransferase 1
MTMRVLDLFSGIGGFALGLERAGMRAVAFCECDPFCRVVLARHWPGVPCYDDVRTLDAAHLRADGIGVDLVCGGFPCQDVSVAGKGAGLAGERSGLWSEYARIIGEVRPRYALVENVAALLGRGLERVLGDLAALGYDAEWHCIPAAAIGAPHLRDRIWIVAYADGGGRIGLGLAQHGDEQGACRHEPDRRSAGRRRARPALADTECKRRQRSAHGGAAAGCGVGVAGRPRLAIGPGTLAEWAHAATTGAGWWAAEPDVGRVVDGPAARVDRRKRLIALGNAVVPDIPQIIGRAILEAEQRGGGG